MGDGGSGRRVVVVGAGVVGMCCARALQRRGFAVTVLDPVPPGESTSSGNAGILAPEAVAPIAMPGVMRQIPKWLLDPLGPLTIRWWYLPRILPWLLRLLANTRPARIERIAAALHALNRPLIDAHRALLGAGDFARLVRTDGLLYAYESPRAFAAAATDWAWRKEHGTGAEILSAARLRELEPALAPGIAGGVFIANGGHVVDPLALVRAIAARFTAEGGSIRRRRAVGFAFADSRVDAVTTDDGPAAADAVVIAAGAWSHLLTVLLGHRVPLEAERGYHLTLAEPGVIPSRPVSLPEGGFFATPMAMGLRLAGTVEFAGLEAPPDTRRAYAMLARAKRVFPGLADSVTSEWMGFRPSLPDSLPVIGPSPRLANVFFAFGHGHLGLSEAAITGRLIAQAVAGEPPEIDLAPYRIDRF